MNEVQKNLKNEMSNSLKELKKKDKDSYHKYIKRNHLDDVESRQKEENAKRLCAL